MIKRTLKYYKVRGKLVRDYAIKIYTLPFTY